MKKLSAVLALLILCALLLASCSFVDPNKSGLQILNQTTAAQTTDAPSPNDPQSPSPDSVNSIIGKWYSKSATTVFQFFSDGTVKAFFIVAGYYEYDTVSSGTYTYDGKNLSLTLEDGSELSSELVFADGSFTVYPNTTNAIVFSPVEELPTEHLKLSYPDYKSLAERFPISTNGLQNTEINTTDLWKNAAESVRTSYWSNVSEDQMIKITDRAVIEGDHLNIDYQGFLNGVAFEGGTAESVQVTAKDGTGMIDGFCSGLIGHPIGEPFEVTVRFPDQYHSADLAGKEAVFRMTVNAIYDWTVTDEMAQSRTYDSFEDWVQETYETALKKNVWDLFPSLSQAELPEEAYAFLYQQNVDYLRSMAFYYGLEYETMLAYYGLTEALLLADCQKTASKNLYAAQIVLAFDLTASNEQVSTVINQFVADYTASGYTQDQAMDLINGEAKNEFQARLDLAVAEDFLLSENTFVYQK